MAKLTRKNIKVFAENASNNGVFGSLQGGNPVTTNDVEQLQSLSAWGLGWNSATMTSEKLPPLEEMQSISYVTTYQQAYIMQEGIPEWASTVTYYKGGLVKQNTASGFVLYYSLTDNNINHAVSDTSNWKKVMDSSDLYAMDNTVVHIIGNETVGGVKTFTETIRGRLGGTYSATPATNQNYFSIIGVDSNGLGTGALDNYTDTNGSTKIRIYSYLPTNLNVFSEVSAYVTSAGDTYIMLNANTVYAPTPTTADNSLKVATTAYVQNNLSGAVSTIKTSNLTSGRVLVSDSSGKVAASVITTTELGYLDNVTSNVQTQLNTKAADSDVVKLTGNQSIAGQKSFSNLKISSVGGEGGQISWEPANTTNASSIETDVVASSSSACSYRIYCQGGTLGVKAFSFDFISGNMNLPSNPAAASNTTVAATTAWVRTLLNGAEIIASGSNYFKLKSGVIIQWGQCEESDSVVFPLPYTSLPCVQLTTYVTTQSQSNRAASVTELTTTGFVPRSEASWSLCWFAIGK